MKTQQALPTSKLIGKHTARPFHLWTEVELRDAQVSSKSAWYDDKWVFDGTTRGRGEATTTIYWNLSLADGSLLTYPQHAVALDYWRRLVWSLFTHTPKGRPLAPGSLQSITESFRVTAAWMANNGIDRPWEADAHLLDNYLDEVLCEKLESFRGEDDDDDGSYGYSTYERLVFLPIRMWAQRTVMEEAGFAPMQEAPYGGLTAHAMAKALGAKATGWIKPMPDEVAIPVLNKAAWFLGIPGEDILRLVEGAREAYTKPKLDISRLKGSEPCEGTRASHQNDYTAQFVFSTLEGSDRPWFILSGDRKERKRQSTFLIGSLRDACVLVLMTQSGVRISEICGLSGGTNPVTGWPTNVRVEPSLTGVNEIFLLRTDLSKTVPVPELHDWVVGMRPKGSNEIPAAVIALRILDRLYGANRVTKISPLIVSLQGGGISKASRSKEISNNTLRSNMKSFVEHWVDLSNLPDQSRFTKEADDLMIWRETKGRCISTHMCRKSWAQFAIDCDPRLLPVISMQFQHLSLAMTEVGYISKNPQQVDLINSVKAYMSAQLMYELARGESRLGGKKGEELELEISALRERIKDAPATKAWVACVRHCEENDIRIFFSPHGGCAGSKTPLAMECHKLAGTQSWRNKEPNFVTRGAQICSGCSCFLISRKNIAFWSDRYVDSAISVIIGEKSGYAGQFTLIKKRRDQAYKILKRLEFDPAPLKARIERGIEEVSHAAA